jgi:putative Holliday junction resolvase
MIGRIVGLDVGDRRIGVAVSDPLGLTAQPVTVLERAGAGRDVEAVEALLARHQAERVIIGLPLLLSGGKGPQAQKVEAFAEALRQRVAVPIELVDERFTTAQATQALREAGLSRRKRAPAIDVVSAQLILQHYLERAR